MLAHIKNQYGFPAMLNRVGGMWNSLTLKQHIPKSPTRSALPGKPERDRRSRSTSQRRLGAILFHQCSTTQKGIAGQHRYWSLAL